MSKSNSKSATHVEQSVESLKTSLKNAPPHVSEDAKRSVERLLAIGEEFTKAQGRRGTVTLEEIPSKFSLKVSLKRILGIFKALAIGVVAYILLMVVRQLFSI